MTKRRQDGHLEEGAPGCSAEEHGGERRSDFSERFSEERFSEERFSEERFSEERFSEERFSDRSFARASGMLRALADEPRLRLLESLSQGEACVTEIAAHSGEGMSTISQRLRLLRSEGLVVGRREGKHVYYSLADSHVKDLLRSVLSHAEEDTSKSTQTTQGESMTENVHTGHDHEHGTGCGHTAIRSHDGHTDYLHEGHLHHQREDGAVEEHALAVNGQNPSDCTPEHAAEHDYEHVHGPNCGHEPVPHGDHTDYLVGDHLHHPHGDHCDDHGHVEVVS